MYLHCISFIVSEVEHIDKCLKTICTSFPSGNGPGVSSSVAGTALTGLLQDFSISEDLSLFRYVAKTFPVCHLCFDIWVVVFGTVKTCQIVWQKTCHNFIFTFVSFVSQWKDLLVYCLNSPQQRLGLSVFLVLLLQPRGCESQEFIFLF